MLSSLSRNFRTAGSSTLTTSVFALSVEPIKVVPLSDLYSRTFPRMETNLRTALIKDEVDICSTNSMCTARTVRQVNKIAHLLLFAHPPRVLRLTTCINSYIGEGWYWLEATCRKVCHDLRLQLSSQPLTCDTLVHNRGYQSFGSYYPKSR